MSWNLIENNFDEAISFLNDGSAVHESRVDLILRGPFSTGPDDCSPTAVYLLLGGGVLTDGQNYGVYGFGGGLEHRLSAGLGIFAEGRYNVIPEIEEDYAQFRTGIRINF